MGGAQPHRGHPATLTNVTAAAGSERSSNRVLRRLGPWMTAPLKAYAAQHDGDWNPPHDYKFVVEGGPTFALGHWVDANKRYYRRACKQGAKCEWGKFAEARKACVEEVDGLREAWAEPAQDPGAT